MCGLTAPCAATDQGAYSESAEGTSSSLLRGAEQKVGAVLITALDEVAWLLNLRGADVDYNPIFISYVIVTPDAATLYLDTNKVL